jgi:nitrite reductase (NO-forming)
MFTRRAALMGAAFVAAAPYVVKTASAQEEATNAGATSVDLSSLTRRKVKLVAPPFVHGHEQVATTGPEIVEFEMKIVEKEIQVDEDAWMQAFTYNGSVPGPMLVVHQDDYVELTLFNPPEKVPPCATPLPGKAIPIRWL